MLIISLACNANRIRNELEIVAFLVMHSNLYATTQLKES